MGENRYRISQLSVKIGIGWARISENTRYSKILRHDIKRSVRTIDLLLVLKVYEMLCEQYFFMTNPKDLHYAKLNKHRDKPFKE